MLFTYLVSLPIGIYSANHQYSPGDYLFTFIGFIGMAVPNFLLAIILMFTLYKWTGVAYIGLFSNEMLRNGIHLYNLGEFLRRMILPLVVIGTSGTCGVIRTVRAQMLDEQSKQYTLTARAKGVSERKITYKYCLRAAINPVVSGLAGSLSGIFTGSTITAIVMNLAIQGPVLYTALLHQDMYLAGTILLVQAFLIVVGTLISDIVLGILDPKIRSEQTREA
jgi:peptide/nickel transport system permease protein